MLYRIAKKRRAIYYGWWMVGISFFGHLLSGGLYNTGLAVYFLPISRDLRLGRAALSFAFTLRSLEGGLDAPLVGYLVDRLGARSIVRVGTVLAGAGFILLAFTHSYATFLLVFLGVLAVGFSAGFSHPMMALTNHWFTRRRALAMTLGFVGTEVGGMVLMPLIALVVLHMGWRQGAVLSGILVLALMPPLTFLIRNTPESMGLQPDGGKASEGPSPGADTYSPAPSAQDAFEADFTVEEALRTRAFWHYSVAMGARIFSKAAIQIHIIPLLVWKGVDEQTAAWLVGLFAFSQVPMRIGASLLGDRWSMTKVPALSTLAGVGAVLVLLLGENSVWTGVLFLLLFSLAECANTVSWAITGHFFGRRNFATLRGGVSMVQSLLSLPAPVLAGWVYDRNQSYSPALIPMVATYLLASLLYWTLRPPRRRSRAAAAKSLSGGEARGMEEEGSRSG